MKSRKKERTVPEKTSAATASLSKDQLEASIKTNLQTLMKPFRVDITHKDDDGNEGESRFSLESQTILSALACLDGFSDFRDIGWKVVVVQELFDEAERESGRLIDAEINRRMTERLAEESSGVFREGVLTLNYSYSHPVLKGKQNGVFVIRYKYNQILHLVQMVNTVLTEEFAVGLKAGIIESLSTDGDLTNLNIKL